MKPNKIIPIIVISALMIYAIITSDAWGADPQCSLIPTQNKSKEEAHYLNPKQISSLTTVFDTSSVAVGSSGRYVLVVTMTNGDNLVFGTYQSEQLRGKAMKHINLKIITCNQ